MKKVEKQEKNEEKLKYEWKNNPKSRNDKIWKKMDDKTVK